MLIKRRLWLHLHQYGVEKNREHRELHESKISEQKRKKHQEQWQCFVGRTKKPREARKMNKKPVGCVAAHLYTSIKIVTEKE